MVISQQSQQSQQPQRTPPGRITPSNGPPQPPPPYGNGTYQQNNMNVQQPPNPQYVPPRDGGYGGGGMVDNMAKDFVNNYAKALIAGAFVCGLGVGVYYDSEVVLSPQNLSSTQLIDRGSPNSDVCMANGMVFGIMPHALSSIHQNHKMISYFHDVPQSGYSSSVFDMKMYVTYNPFNVSNLIGDGHGAHSE